MKKTWKKLLLSFSMLCVGVVGHIFTGYTLSILWQWFIVTAFAAPPISVVQAIGVVLVVQLMTFKAPPDCVLVERDAFEKAVRGILINLVIPASFLLTGWIVRMFM